MDRQQANITLAYLLLEIIKEQPDLRFGQILTNYGFVNPTTHGGTAMGWEDEFYVEPDKVLERVTKVIENE